MLTEYKPNRSLRSLGSHQLEIPRVKAWQLEPEIRCAPTVVTFKSRLETHLFSCAFTEWALCHCSSVFVQHFICIQNCFNYSYLFWLF